MRLRLWTFAVLLSALSGCDKEPTKLDRLAEAAAAPPRPAVTTPPPPAPPAAPTITVDDGACTVNGEEILFAAADARDRVATALAGKPLVEGHMIDFDAVREAKTPRVEAVLYALRKSKATGAVIHTPSRDKTMAILTLKFGHDPATPCAPVAMITKDGSIAVWSAAGGTAQKFARGFAGPDLTLGSEGLRKIAASCGGAVWAIGADDNIPWGLTFDLAMRALGAGEAGAPIKATETVVLGEAPVPGRRVEIP